MWLRCDGLGGRPLWYDEAATLLHLAGRSEGELRSWYDGRPVRAGDLLAAAHTPIRSVVATAWRDEPQSGPLYFAAAHAWAQVAGPSLAAVRAFSVAASLVALPLAYGVGVALFADRGAALAVTALVASSPLHLRYAQEARPYALWSALLLAWVLATLHAREGGDVRRAALATGLYVACLLVHPLTLLALPAVAALVACDRRWVRATALATIGWAAGGALMWPERATVAATTTWTAVPTSVTALARGWAGVVTSVFVRPGGEGSLLAAWGGGAVATAIWLALGLGVLGLAVVALATLPAAPTARAFVRRASLVPWGVLAAADLVVGGRRSTVARYLVPSWIGIELAVGRRLASGRAAPFLLAVVTGFGVASGLATRAVPFWWDTDGPRLQALATTAAAATRHGNAVVLTDVPPLVLLELAHRWPAATEIRLGTGIPDVASPPPERWRLVMPSDALRAAAARALGGGRMLEAVPDAPDVWRVAARSTP